MVDINRVERIAHLSTHSQDKLIHRCTTTYDFVNQLQYNTVFEEYDEVDNPLREGLTQVP